MCGLYYFGICDVQCMFCCKSYSSKNNIYFELNLSQDLLKPSIWVQSWSIVFINIITNHWSTIASSANSSSLYFYLAALWDVSNFFASALTVFELYNLALVTYSWLILLHGFFKYLPLIYLTNGAQNDFNSQYLAMLQFYMSCSHHPHLWLPTTLYHPPLSYIHECLWYSKKLLLSTVASSLVN